MNTYLEALRIQRWDDHRYYHHSRINQSLHFVSACCFLVAYVCLFTDPALAGKDEAACADEVQRLVDAAVMVVSMVVPTLNPESFEIGVHGLNNK